MLGCCARASRFGIRRLLSAVGAVAFSGCASVYAPSTVNAPLLNGAGEIHLEGASAANGTALTAAYALTDHIAVMGKYASAGLKEQTAQQATANPRASEIIGLRRKYGELGAGAFAPLGPLRFEAFAGAGWGKSRAHYVDNYVNLCSHGPCPADYEVQAAGTYRTGFLQGDVGFRAKVVDFGMSMRLAYLRFAFREIDNVAVSKRDTVTSVEPTAFVRLGYNAIRVALQAGPVWVVGSAKRKDAYGDAPLVATPGIHVSLGLHGQFALFSPDGHAGGEQ
ncbi:MAG: hypothetical protein AAB426_07855 [Myxococcota bacterium]